MQRSLFSYACTCNNILTSKGKIDLKGLLSTSIASAITAAERLLEEMGAIPSDPHLNRHDHSFNDSLDL